jgi:hypothetical protein
MARAADQLVAGPSEEQPLSTLAVTAQLVGRGGPPPAGSMSPIVPQPLGPAAGVVVQAVAPAAPDVVVAEAITDDLGRAQLQVPAATYWVFIPWSDGLPGLPAAALVTTLPSGARVYAYQEVTAASGATVPVNLSISVMLP